MTIRIDGTNTTANPGITGADADTGLQFGTDEVRIVTGGSDRATIDSSGRLLVGTSSALSNLSYETTAALSPQIQLVGSTASTAHLGIVRTSGGGPADLTLGWGSSGNVAAANQEVGTLLFSTFDGSAYRNAAYILCEADGAHAAGDTPGRLVFSTTADGASVPTERMRIGNDGQISTTAGATPGTSTFGTSLGRSNSPGLFENYRNGTATITACRIGGPLGEALIKCDGDLENTNNRYTGISDVKLKENIVDAGSQWNDLKAIRIRNYNFKEETGFNTHTQIGLVAQEVELVSPGLVGETVNDDTGEVTKNVAYSVLYMKAVKALQEAMERIETLEARLTALEGGTN